MKRRELPIMYGIFGSAGMDTDGLDRATMRKLDERARQVQRDHGKEL